MLLCHRHPDRRWYPDLWDLPGGHIQPGERPVDAVVRELHEELGIEVDTNAVSRFETRYPTADLELHIAVARRWGGRVANCAPDEHDALGWFTRAELPNLSVADADVVQLCAAALDASPQAAPTETSFEFDSASGQVLRFASKRLIGTRMRGTDAEQLELLHGDPAVMAMIGGMRTQQASSEWLQRNIGHWERHGFGQWVLHTRSGRLVGRGGLRMIDDCVGTTAFIDLARSHYGLDELGAITLEGNDASAHVLNKKVRLSIRASRRAPDWSPQVLHLTEQRHHIAPDDWADTGDLEQRCDPGRRSDPARRARPAEPPPRMPPPTAPSSRTRGPKAMTTLDGVGRTRWRPTCPDPAGGQGPQVANALWHHDVLDGLATLHEESLKRRGHATMVGIAHSNQRLGEALGKCTHARGES